MILPDNETKVDLLNSEAIALTAINMLRGHPDKPVTLGIHGDWGAGKSSVLEMIEDSLEGEKNVLCIKFNGWRFQGFEDAKIALIEGIVTSLIEKRPALTKASSAVKNLLKRIDYLKLAKRGGGLLWNFATGMPSPDQVQEIASGLSHLATNPGELATRENLEKAAKNVGGLLKPAEAKRVPEEVEEFRKAFDKLLDDAAIDQLVVLIDDLDRCLPDTAIETLEAVRLFVSTKRTVFIVGADEAMIEYAVRKHFPGLPETTGPRDYARNYLEKLIQVPFRIPALGETETRIYVALLLIGALVGEDDQDFQKLIKEGRERLKRPWASKPLDATAVRTALGDKAGAAQEMLGLSDQTGPILASGTKGNPRQIKRFLNTLLLRKSIAEARGFGDDVQLPVLAKLMLAERFWPAFFDQIAERASIEGDGRCKELGVLEAAIGERKAGKKPPLRPKKVAADNNQVVLAWLASEAITSWAELPPKLGNVDLRPYLFVAKDKKDYFAVGSVLGRLEGLIERLMGQKLAVQIAASDIKLLAAPDSTAVFEELRLNILGKDSYATKPAGIDGMVAVVAAHPHLESNLLDLLDALPTAKLGAWATAGWESCLREPSSKARLRGILEKWSQSGGMGLKAAAAAVLSMDQR